MPPARAHVPARAWLTEADCDLGELRSLVEAVTDPADHPAAERVEQSIPLYDSGRLRELARTPPRGARRYGVSWSGR